MNEKTTSIPQAMLDEMTPTYEIVMTREQLRVIEHALRHADMTAFIPAPFDALDAEGSTPEGLAEMARDTLNDEPGETINGWAI